MEQLPLFGKLPPAGPRADRQRVAVRKKQTKVQISAGGTQGALPLTREPKVRAKCPVCGKSMLGLKQHIINAHGAIAGQDFTEIEKRPKPEVASPKARKSATPTPKSKKKKSDSWRQLKAKHPAEYKRLNKRLAREKKLQKEEEKKSKRQRRIDHWLNIYPEAKRPVSGGAVELGKRK